MKIVKGNCVVLSTKEDYVIIAQEMAPSVFDPAGEIAAIVQGYKVVAALDGAGDTQVLVPLGKPKRVTAADLRDRTVYTVPPHVGGTINVPRGSNVVYYDPESK